MDRTFAGRTIAFCVLAFVAPLMVHAGNNAGGSAQLSWDPAAVVHNLDRPPGPEVPFYVRLNGADDVQGLTLWFNWTPFDSTGFCYSLA
ncbi:MAG: hypothetical protein ACRENJ_02370, partial [Candidatus Eiseniibacteriota bacterium]